VGDVWKILCAFWLYIYNCIARLGSHFISRCYLFFSLRTIFWIQGSSVAAE